MAFSCPFDTTHKSFGTRESLAAHIQTLHQEAVDSGIEPIPTVENFQQNTVTKVTENIDDLEVPPPIQSAEDVSAYMAKSKQPTTEELLAMVKAPAPIVEVVEDKKEATPITLTYKFVGDCPTCFRSIDTLFLDTESKTKIAAIAYCMTCKKQARTLVVPRIGGDTNDKEERQTRIRKYESEKTTGDSK